MNEFYDDELFGNRSSESEETSENNAVEPEEPETLQAESASAPEEGHREVVISLDQGASGGSPSSMTANYRPRTYTENISGKKKNGKMRYIAAGLAITVLNLAVLGGMYALGYKNGSGSQGNVDKTALINELKSDSENGYSSGNVENANLTEGELSTTQIAQKAGPSVVGITSKVQASLGFFGSSIAESTGSGVILSNDGYIVTNNHVVDGSVGVTVQLSSGNVYDAEIIGTDEQTDLAVIKINANEPLTAASLGDSSKLEIGEKAVAIGNPMGLEFFGSVTEGVISGLNRTITVENRTMNVIQTDAAINSGNSGGALVNGRGEVIGINAVKISSSTAEGMGFAIPISEAEPIIADLIEYGYVKGRPVIGITTRDITDYVSSTQGVPVGVQIWVVQEGSGAAAAGLEQGDIILKADDTKVETYEDLNKVKDTHKAGEVIKLEVYKYRTGQTVTVDVPLSEQTPEK